MDEVSMNDGLDTPETIAFGLGAAEICVVVVALLSAYALVGSGLPAPLAWPPAVLLAAAGAALGWMRVADRSLAVWAGVLACHGWRRRGEGVAVARAWAGRRTRGGLTLGRALQARVTRVGDLGRQPQWGRATRLPERGGVTVRLFRPGRLATPSRAVGRGAPPIGPGGRAWRVGFFSLRGGTGRTALACEVGAILAARGRSVAPHQHKPGMRVTLVDLDGRLPAAALRLGLPLLGPDVSTEDCPAPAVRHRSGLDLVAAGVEDDPEGAGLEDLIDTLEANGAEVIVLDLGADAGERTRAALGSCDEVVVVITPTAGGVLDAYRSTALLRGMALGCRLTHVVNRDSGADLDEVCGDLGIAEMVRIPDDAAIVDAENRHRVCGLEDGGPAALALCALTAAINERALAAARRVDAEEAWGGRVG